MGNYYSIEKKLRIKETAAREKTIAIFELLGWDRREFDTGDIELASPGVRLVRARSLLFLSAKRAMFL